MSKQQQLTKFNHRIKHLRQAHNLTQEQANELMGWANNVWHLLENGKAFNNSRRAELYQQVAEKFGVEPAYLRERPPHRMIGKVGKPITVVKRINALRDAGWTYRDIAVATDLHTTDVAALYGKALRRSKNKRYTLPAEEIIRILDNTPALSEHDADEMVPARPVREHLLKLDEVGYGRIRHRSKVADAPEDRNRDGLIMQLVLPGREALGALYRPSASRILVRHDAAQSVLDVPADVNARIPTALGAARRIRGLIAWGYDPEDLQQRIGLSDLQMHRLLWTDCEAPLERNIGITLVKTFSKLEHIKGKSEKAVEMAEKYGWELPFQWDEYSIDKLAAKCYPRRKNRARVYEISPERRAEILRRELQELALTAGMVA